MARVDELLAQAAKLTAKLVSELNRYAQRGEYKAASNLENNLTRTIADYRRRLKVAWERAANCDESGTYTVEALAAAWHQIESQVPGSPSQRHAEIRNQERDQMLLRRLAASKGCEELDHFNRTRRGRRVNKKMDPVAIAALSDRLAQPKKRMSERQARKKGVHMTQDDATNCTFTLDLGACRKRPATANEVKRGFVSTVGRTESDSAKGPSVDPDEAKIRHKENWIQSIELSILPSTGYRGKKIDPEFIDTLVTCPEQVQYWGFSEGDVFLVMRAPAKDKIEKLARMIAAKRFVQRMEEDRAKDIYDYDGAVPIVSTY